MSPSIPFTPPTSWCRVYNRWTSRFCCATTSPEKKQPPFPPIHLLPPPPLVATQSNWWWWTVWQPRCSGITGPLVRRRPPLSESPGHYPVRNSSNDWPTNAVWLSWSSTKSITTTRGGGRRHRLGQRRTRPRNGAPHRPRSGCHKHP